MGQVVTLSAVCAALVAGCATGFLAGYMTKRDDCRSSKQRADYLAAALEQANRTGRYWLQAANKNAAIANDRGKRNAELERQLAFRTDPDLAALEADVIRALHKGTK